MAKTAAAKAAAKAAALVTITLPALGKDEINVGLIMEKGAPNHWLILLPGDADGVTWAQAQEFAKKAGGELPTRREQSLLFANNKTDFKERFYWSAEQHAGDDECAWSQYFSLGYQTYGHKGYSYRARAVRRAPIQ